MPSSESLESADIIRPSPPVTTLIDAAVATGRATILPIVRVSVFAPPYIRETNTVDYPDGVVTGGALIDMAEHLSRTLRCSDWALSLWIQEHYINPFKRIKRRDSIIVASEADMIVLRWAHQRYTAVNPMPIVGLPPQPLWVPGLEPLGRPESVIELLDLPWIRWQEAFSGGDMKGQRRGEFLGEHVDVARGWLWELWRLPVM
ncbi:hypothetical protein K458DRAFT_465425 [Lentithecium fluviatile CBS 122367]|uniref:Uncharacterized protein n=1 Tax=Lentithecium fluviatile CBS 122367 TaxID=1168545 RepID=A0A6G1JDY5_9PLEO|nr:hypothetical protein K458DRAFT_465425 [Lentithecium fluviatile CBS 122367]